MAIDNLVMLLVLISMFLDFVGICCFLSDVKNFVRKKILFTVGKMSYFLHFILCMMVVLQFQVSGL